MYFLHYVMFASHGGNIMNEKKIDFSGLVNCLGWCGKQFHSNDKIRVRFCKKCAVRREEEYKRSKMKPKYCSLDMDND